jgi:hypothetical protein
VADWPREVRYFWVLLWGYLDDHGRGVDDARLIKADCFPLDEDLDRIVISEWLNLLASSGPLCQYQVDGKRYLHIPSWTEHQRPSHAGKSRIPLCPHHDSGNPPETLAKVSGDSRETLVPEQGAGSREQGAGSARGDAPERLARKSTGLTPEVRARQIVQEFTDATDAEADDLVAQYRKDRKPHSLNGLLTKIGRDGELTTKLDEARAARRQKRAEADLKAIRAGPKCVHGEGGGASPHPTSGLPVCPQCRSTAQASSLNSTARTA